MRFDDIDLHGAVAILSPLLSSHELTVRLWEDGTHHRYEATFGRYRGDGDTFTDALRWLAVAWCNTPNRHDVHHSG